MLRKVGSESILTPLFVPADACDRLFYASPETGPCVSTDDRGGVMMLRAATVVLAAFAVSMAAPPGQADDKQELVDRGRYLVRIAGCNDCHTAGYTEAAGEVPEREWLKGGRLGWHGPWGTTYATNLRLYMADLGESEWIARAREMKTRPPMPWFAIRAMSERDLRALYRFIRHLGSAGEPAPEFVPPGREPPAPYVRFPMPSQSG